MSMKQNNYLESLTQEQSSTIARLEQENRALTQKVAELVALQEIDPLTGLLNRWAFVRRLQNCIDNSRNHPGSNYVIYLDVDGFKAFNNEHQHLNGDRVLIAVGHAIDRVTRAGDNLASRVGGDEFAILIARATQYQAERIALRIVHEISQQRIELSSGAIVSVTASVGHTPIYNDDSAESVINRADTGMQSAKDAGRNQARAA